MFMRVVGTHHGVRLTNAGIQLSNEQGTTSYRPPLDWSKARVAEWLMTNRGRKFDVYLEGFESPALVYDNGTGKLVAWFTPIEKVEYSQKLRPNEASRQALGQSEAIRKEQARQAKEKTRRAKEAFPNALENLEALAHQTGDLTLQGGNLVNTKTGEILKASTDKDDLNAAEEAFKAGAMPAQDTEEIEGVHFAWVEHPKKPGTFYKSYNPEHFQK
jgi:hypothetical protein